MSYYNKRQPQVEYVSKNTGPQDTSAGPKKEEFSSSNKNAQYDSYEQNDGQSRNERTDKNPGRSNGQYNQDGSENKPYNKNNNRRRNKPINQDSQGGQGGQGPRTSQNNQNTQNTQNVQNNQNPQERGTGQNYQGQPQRKQYNNYRGDNYNGGNYYGQQWDEYDTNEEYKGDGQGSRGYRGGRGNRGNQGGGGRGSRGGRGGRGGSRGGGYQGYGDEESNRGQSRQQQVKQPKEQEKDKPADKEEEPKEGNDDVDSVGEEHEIEDFSQVPMSELAEILKERFVKGQIECPICFNKVKRDAKIWSCKQCFGPFHLSCITKWINKNPANQKDGKPIPNLKLHTWACPKCNYNYTDPLPEYKCFCAKEANPEYDPYNTPHSCSNTCGKTRGHACIHPCPLECHPGPCPPCKSLGREQACHCGAKSMRMRCGDEAAGFSCGGVCSKTLNCGNHSCSQTCHSGKCPKCEVTVESKCHCGKKDQMRECGNEAFSCSQVCGKTLNCGNHPCKEICHSGPCPECPYTPDKMTTCCCGRMSAMALGADNRKSCLDPIPICGLPCNKVMICGHKCKRMCHPYECGPCKEIVVQMCRCGKNDRKIECYKTTKGDEEERLFLCDRVCKKLKTCRIHKCQQVCCEANKGNDPEGRHLCIKVCGKPLGCGKHSCEDFCHLGNCKPCPIIINYPLTCSCGKTSKFPPMQCGTSRPECNLPCSREQACGHPCYLKCHYDACPPCEELIEKPCRCGKKILQNVRCGRIALCGVPCTTILPCGHKCNVVCHEGECDMERGVKGCGAKCKKVKKRCGHTCEQLCHPTQPCPENKCKVQVKITCDCGNREALVYCEEREKAKLECDRTCANMKRFGNFIQKDASKKSYYPAILINFARNNLSYVLKVEDKLEQMVKDGQSWTDIPLYENAIPKKNAMYQLLSRHYGLDMEFYLHVKNPHIIVRWTRESKLPPLKLSEYLRQVETGKVKPDVSPFEATIKFYNLSMHDSTEDLERILREFQDEYYIERAENKQPMVHFWKKDVAEVVLRVLKKSVTNFSSALLEENLELKAEEEKISSVDAEIKVNMNQSEKEIEEENKNASILLSFNK